MSDTPGSEYESELDVYPTTSCIHSTVEIFHDALQLLLYVKGYIPVQYPVLTNIQLAEEQYFCLAYAQMSKLLSNVLTCRNSGIIREVLIMFEGLSDLPSTVISLSPWPCTHDEYCKADTCGWPDADERVAILHDVAVHISNKVDRARGHIRVLIRSSEPLVHGKVCGVTPRPYFKLPSRIEMEEAKTQYARITQPMFLPKRTFASVNDGEAFTTRLQTLSRLFFLVTDDDTDFGKDIATALQLSSYDNPYTEQACIQEVPFNRKASTRKVRPEYCMQKDTYLLTRTPFEELPSVANDMDEEEETDDDEDDEDVDGVMEVEPAIEIERVELPSDLEPYKTNDIWYSTITQDPNQLPFFEGSETETPQFNSIVDRIVPAKFPVQHDSDEITESSMELIMTTPSRPPFS